MICPRCAGPGLLAVAAAPDAVLCASCDLYSPTAGPVVLWFIVNGRLETDADVEEVTALLQPWLDTVMP